MTRWTFTMRPEGDGPPVECRVRRLLKFALRTCGLRCIDVRQEPATGIVTGPSKGPAESGYRDGIARPSFPAAAQLVKVKANAKPSERRR